MASIELRMSTKKAADFVRLIELYDNTPHGLMATGLAHKIATTLVGMHTLSDDAPGTMYLSALVHQELRRGHDDDEDDT